MKLLAFVLTGLLIVMLVLGIWYKIEYDICKNRKIKIVKRQIAIKAAKEAECRRLAILNADPNQLQDMLDKLEIKKEMQPNNYFTPANDARQRKRVRLEIQRRKSFNNGMHF